ncbi:8056_t:CDS:2 [Funneliformis caledonium]|uniref:8056_t:CDS:1 n=1 Tax=Funneliformis caledonium TaxID=1117310 RepID=A0A9N9HMW4_9GLOM|nr:8056_t:CDS:2 [Funneliformis caledonium]
MFLDSFNENCGLSSKYNRILWSQKIYSLILEYANGGTLGKYLRDNVKTFKCKWESQLKFAHDIASAVSCLHDNKIIHRDLVKILEGERVKPISTTNGKFVNLYQRCWKHEPDERPDIYQVISELNSVTDSNSEESVRTEETENDEREDHFFDCDIARYCMNSNV